MDSIRVMVSSRVDVPLGPGAPGATVGDAAKAIASKLEDKRLFPDADFDEKPLFRFDLSLEDKARPADKTIEEHCREMVSTADIVLVLYNGQAGSSLQNGADGICFLEMRMAMDQAPQKVVAVRLPPPAGGAKRDKRFRAWFDSQQLWVTDDEAATVPDVVDAASQALRVAVARMVHGSGRAKTGAFHLGEALAWTRMNYADRADAMRRAVAAVLREQGGSDVEQVGKTLVAAAGDGGSLLTWVHAVPAALSEPRAREMVGQPYLRDHELAGLLDPASSPGPLHLVACARGVTESQAIRILGFPDATIIKAPFGVYVADEIQKTQMAFLAQCRDEATTRDAVAEFAAWLERTGEREAIVARGRLRAKLAAILAEDAGAS